MTIVLDSNFVAAHHEVLAETLVKAFVKIALLDDVGVCFGENKAFNVEKQMA